MALCVISEKSPELLCEEINKRGLKPISIVASSSSRVYAFYEGEPAKKQSIVPVGAKQLAKPESPKLEAKSEPVAKSSESAKDEKPKAVEKPVKATTKL
jgi:hypothetical protein